MLGQLGEESEAEEVRTDLLASPVLVGGDLGRETADGGVLEGVRVRDVTARK